MERVTTTYTRFTHTVAKSGRCPVCHGRVRRSRTFSQTASPFNRTNGRPSTPLEIRAALVREAEDWAPDFRHTDCR